jgi:hypothetical protein
LLITIKSQAAAREKMMSAPVARLHPDGAASMSARADKPILPVVIPAHGGGGGAKTALQDRVWPRTIDPCCSPAEA